MPELTDTGLCDLEERFAVLIFTASHNWERSVKIDRLERDIIVEAINNLRRKNSQERELKAAAAIKPRATLNTAE